MLNPICGIIAEYNPFHAGHAWQLEQAKRVTQADAVVVVMSASFVQRGEPAILSAYDRAKLAVAHGADLVVEMPFAYSCASAQLFARGGVALLKALGIVTHMAFGSEVLDGDLLYQSAMLLDQEPPQMQESIQASLRAGKNIAQAKQEALDAVTGHGEILRQPNTVLGIEYLQALKRANADIQPVLLPRIGAAENDPELGEIPSASAIRRALREGKSWPGDPISKLVWPDGLAPLLRYRWMTNPESFRQVPDMEDGLFYRIKDGLNQGLGWEPFIQGIATKRYPQSRIRRALIHGLVGLTHQDIQIFREEYPVYVRVLAMSENGKMLLGKIPYPIAKPQDNEPSSYAQSRLIALSRQAYRLYALLSGGEFDQDMRWRLLVTKPAPMQWFEPVKADIPCPAVFLPLPRW